MLVSSLGAQVLIVGMVVEGMGSGTSCASVPPAVGTKVEYGASGGVVGALGNVETPTFRVLTLELAALDVFGTTRSITPFPFKSLLD